MATGYVLDFTDRTFQEFVGEHAGVDIYGGAYSKNGTSKAKHLLVFWELEPDELVARLSGAMVNHAIDRGIIDAATAVPAQTVVSRLAASGPVPDLGAIRPNAPELTFKHLSRSIREAIDAGRPEEAMDRLHTFVVKYMRVLCGKYGIDTPRSKPLHSMFGEYLKRLQAEGRLQSIMTQRIMKSAISSLEAFNDVRNDQSFAHDNEILKSHEALYILNHVASLLRLIQVVEGATPDVPSDT